MTGIADAGIAAMNLSLVPSTDPSTLSPEEFKEAFRAHPSGVAVITADDGTGPVAMTASSMFSLSAVPPLVVFSASSISSSTPTIRESSTVVLHLIGADDLWLARLGSTSGVDRFGDGIEWDRLPTGEPYYPSVQVRLLARIQARLDAGSAIVFVVEVLEATGVRADGPERPPLVYHDRSWHRLGDASRVVVPQE